MAQTQIQFPDGLYKRLKRLAAEQEWSLAETLRRGGELLLGSRPLAEPPNTQTWAMEPLANTQLRCDPFADED